MNRNLRIMLLRCETDLDGALHRFMNDEEFYVHCLCSFLTDRSMPDLEEALAARSWDEAFTAAHALKGLAGNMGFVPLFHAAAELVVLLRSGRTGAIGDSYLELKRCYEDLFRVIQQYCMTRGCGHERRYE